jgi:LuxR family maltose regulon positive regulatory protein
MARLCARVLKSCQPIIWIAGIAGSGKTRLLRQLSQRIGREPAGAYLLFDDPTADVLGSAMASLDSVSEHPARHLVVAARPAGAVSRALLAARLYGGVDVIDDGDLFLRADECQASDGTGVYRLTGGWPMLAQAWASGREAQITELLPEFLAVEVIPTLPHALVTALFAALIEPLTAPAIEHLLGPTARLHPLLKSTPAGVCIAGDWIGDALRRLRGRREALSDAVRAELVQVHSTFGDPVRAIIALNAIGRSDDAVALFEHGGGPFFGFRHGFPALATVLQSFGAELENRRESLLLSRLFLLFKSGQTHEALRRLDAHFPRLPVDLRRMQASHRAYAVLLRLDIAAGFDESIPAEVVTSWARLEAFLPREDHLARGVLYNTMTIGFLRVDELSQARQFARDALDAYRRARSPYLMYFMQLHLTDIALRQSRLRDAAELLRDAQRALRQSGFGTDSELTMLQVFQARLAYEQGQFEDCPAQIDATLEALTTGDSWPGLIRSLLDYAPLVAFWRHGLRAALETAERCMLTLGRRHGPTEDRGLSLLRVRLYQVARRHAEAAGRLAELDLQPIVNRTHQLAAEEALIRLRLHLVQQMPGESILQAARTIAELPRLETRQRISCAILQAALQHRLRDHGAAKRHLLLALRMAQTEGLVGVLIEDAEFLERLLPPLISDPGPGNEALALFARRVAGLLRALPTTALRSRAVAGVSPQELRVLVHLSDNCTNKQIARALGVGESAVKFHLRNLFRKLKVERRAALLQRAREAGLLS